MTLAPTTPTPKSQKWWQKRPAQILIAVIFVAIVVFVVSRSIKPEEFEKAFKDMQPLWFIAAFAIGTLTWVGAAIPMKVFAPIKVPFRDALLTQVASSFVGVVAPAGLGALALSIRFLVKRGMQTSQAVATMILMELSQFLTSFILVLAAIFLVGVDPDIRIPWHIVGWVAFGVLVVALLALAIPQSRKWIFTQVKSVWTKAYPQAVWAFKHPKSLGLAMFGALLQTLSFAGSFMFSLLAFGATVDFWKGGGRLPRQQHAWLHDPRSRRRRLDRSHTNRGHDRHWRVRCGCAQRSRHVPPGHLLPADSHRLGRL